MSGERTAEQPRSRGPAAGWLRRAVPVAVSLTCLGLLIWLFWARLPAVWSVVREVHAGALVLALVPFLLGLYLQGARLKLILAAFGNHQTTFRCFLYTLIGYFFSNFLPTALGGDVLKASYAAGDSDRVAESFLATFVDRGIGLLGLLLVGSVGAVFFPSLQGTTSILWLPVVMVGGLVLLLWFSRLDRPVGWLLTSLDRVGPLRRLQVTRLLRALIGLARQPGVLLGSLALTFVIYAVVALALWVLAWALGLGTSYLIFLLLLPVLSLTLMLPSINGIGVREVTFVVLLQGLAPEEGALALAIVYYGLGLATGALGGLVFLLRKPLGLALSPALTGWFTRRRA